MSREKKTKTSFSREVRERAIRLVLERERTPMEVSGGEFGGGQDWVHRADAQ